MCAIVGLGVRALDTVHGKEARTYNSLSTCGCCLAQTLGCKCINAGADMISECVDGTMSSTDAKSAGVDKNSQGTNVCMPGADVCAASVDGNELGTENNETSAGGIVIGVGGIITGADVKKAGARAELGADGKILSRMPNLNMNTISNVMKHLILQIPFTSLQSLKLKN
jgi:hypothetical protein